MRKGLIVISVLILMLVLPKEVSSAGAGTITITVTIAEVEIIEATVEFRPKIIQSGFRFIRSYIELPLAYKVEDINVETVALTEVNGNLAEPPLKTIRTPGIGDFDRDGIADLMVWFDIQSITPLLKPGENVLAVTGNLIDGRTFKGKETLFIKTVKSR